MSKLEDLIRDLCPNGVEYVRFQDVCEYIRGVTYNKAQEARFGDVSPWKIFRANNITLSANALNFDDVKLVKREVKVKPGQMLKMGDILICAGSGSKEHVGKVAYIAKDMDYTFGGFMAVIRCNKTLNSRFMFHILTSGAFSAYLSSALNSTTINNLNSAVMSSFSFPLPPLPVQREIVRILDNFTELTAELTARRKQYNYYRDELLTFAGETPKVRLEEIATDIYRGSGVRRDQVTQDGVPCVRYGEIYTTYNTWFDKCVSHTQLEYVANPKYVEYGDILFAITGENIEDIAKSVAYVGHEKCIAGGDIVVMKHKQNPKYLAYALSTYDARQQKGKGKVKSKVVHSSVPAIKNILIPLPPLDVQERLANILDNFEAIGFDLTVGLPAEIEARRKQYEYYRDQLLSFKELA